jgi:hypothetical protein
LLPAELVAAVLVPPEAEPVEEVPGPALEPVEAAAVVPLAVALEEEVEPPAAPEHAPSPASASEASSERGLQVMGGSSRA